MGRLMHDAYGIGLAATQVGVMHRLLVYRTELEGSVAALVNPVLEWSSKDKETSEEGCLSLPGVGVDVERPVHVRVSRARRARQADPRRGVRPGGARDPARDGPPRRRADPRPHLARPAQAGHAHPPRAARAATARLEKRLPRHHGVRGGRAAGARRLRAPSAARRHPARRQAGPRPEARAAARRGAGARARDRGHPARGPARAGGAASDRGRRARGAHHLRVRRADQGAAAQRLRDDQRAPVAAAALARGGADRARDHGRRRRDRRGDHARDRGLGLRRRSTRSAREPIHARRRLRHARARGWRRSARDLLVKVLDERPTPVEQDESQVTYANKIGPRERALDPTQTPEQVERTIRALRPHIGSRLPLPDGTLPRRDRRARRRPDPRPRRRPGPHRRATGCCSTATAARSS